MSKKMKISVSGLKPRNSVVHAMLNHEQKKRNAGKHDEETRHQKLLKAASEAAWDEFDRSKKK